MFFPARIRHVELYVENSNIREFLLDLHSKGICQIKEAEDWEKEELEEFKDLFLLYSEAMNVKEELDHYKPSLGFKSILKKKEKIKVERRTDDQVIEEARKLIDKIKENIRNDLAKLEEELESVNEKLKTIEYFPPDLDLSNYLDSDNIKVLVGLVLANKKAEIKNVPGVKLFRPVNKRLAFLAVFLGIDETSKALEALHRIGFNPITLPSEAGKPWQVREALVKRREELVSRINAEKARLTNLWIKEHTILEAAIEELEIVLQRVKAYGSIGEGFALAKLEAWVPEKNWDEFIKTVKRHFKEYYLVSRERSDAPTLLENPQPIRAYETITRMYGLPGYGRIDPTPVLAFTFALFFGFMLTDAVYGILLVLAGLALAKLAGEDMKDFGTILTLNGMFTLGLGALFGSWLGSLLTDAWHIPYWVDPMKEATTVLMLALAIGLTHLSIGYLFGLINGLKEKNWMAILRPALTMLLFVSAIVLFALAPEMKMLALALIGVSVIMNFVASFLEQGAILSALSIFDYTGFLGNWFSYARLMSLALGTAGIALAVNFMANLVGGMIPVIGGLVAVVILAIGHLFNLGINSLGAFVHSLRLHFLEFFSAFYEGKGIPYEPFYAKRKLTEVEEK